MEAMETGMILEAMEAMETAMEERLALEMEEMEAVVSEMEMEMTEAEMEMLGLETRLATRATPAVAPPVTTLARHAKTSPRMARHGRTPRDLVVQTLRVGMEMLVQRGEICTRRRVTLQTKRAVLVVAAFVRLAVVLEMEMEMQMEAKEMEAVVLEMETEMVEMEDAAKMKDVAKMEDAAKVEKVKDEGKEMKDVEAKDVEAKDVEAKEQVSAM